jgi:uncharacterized protein YyaL (SSP411 family)
VKDEVRTTAEIRRQGNRLRDEASLYLQQHAHNPVDWQPWGEAALERARSQDRPIFLSSGYSSCHWCHVMEHEVFESDEVAEVLNRHFVCIKVDREELPAVDATYMEAVQLLTGHGGWPLSAFLTPDLEPFFGGTYFPRDRFLGLLMRIVELWTTRRGDLERQAAEVAARLGAEFDLGDRDGELDADGLAARAAEDVRERWDERHGGLAGAMKFPVPPRWRALLTWYRRSGDPTAREMVAGTLEAMARGGLRDHIGGGFHRYTVDADWTVPHFEKMLYDNAQLATLFLEAGAALERPDFTAVGLDTLAFLDREMADPGGACHASFDADSGGVEGSYYVWTPQTLADAVGPQDGPVLADLLGVDEAGNFEHGTSVVTRRRDPAAIAREHGRDAEEVAGLFARHRDRLRAVRDERTPPSLDRKVVTAWNGLALTAFARGHAATGEAWLLRRAETIAAALRRDHRDARGRLCRASNGGRPSGPAGLDDHAQLATGLLDLFQVTGDAAHLAWAEELLAIIDDHFVREGGGWYATADDAPGPLGRRMDLFDNVTPGGGSATVDAMVTLAALTGREDVRQKVRDQLLAHAGLLARAGLDMAGWLVAALRFAGPLHEVVVAGDPRSAATGELREAALGGLSPGVVVTLLPAEGAPTPLGERAPVLQGKTAADGHPTAYVCRQGNCDAPTRSPEAVRSRIGDGWPR